jgi:hypothetical protein
MNATLAALYGTGLEKTASEGEELDLHSISAADFLEALEELESEKVAGEEDGDFDLSDLSDDELISLYNEMESEDTIEKMASSGELEYWDMAGRVMAHAYADELSKTASEYDYEEEIDLNEFSPDELIALGHELELEKEAGMMDKLRGFRAAKQRQAAEAATRTAEGVVREGTRRSVSARKGAALRARMSPKMRARVANMSDAELGMLAASGKMSAMAGVGGAAAGAVGGAMMGGR